MKRTAKNLILLLPMCCAVFFAGSSPAYACGTAQWTSEKFVSSFEVTNSVGIDRQFLDFWGKFRDTVMPDESSDKSEHKKHTQKDSKNEKNKK